MTSILMNELSGIDLPPPLLSALRDGRLVVFAGAGVSMEAPACLPDFTELCREIAQGTGKAPQSGESQDRFLGRLRHGGVDVHELAKRALEKRCPKPTDLHRDLAGLFSSESTIRIVTTNSISCLNRRQRSVLPAQSLMYFVPQRCRLGRHSMASSMCTAPSTAQWTWSLLTRILGGHILPKDGHGDFSSACSNRSRCCSSATAIATSS